MAGFPGVFADLINVGIVRSDGDPETRRFDDDEPEAVLEVLVNLEDVPPRLLRAVPEDMDRTISRFQLLWDSRDRELAPAFVRGIHVADRGAVRPSELTQAVPLLDHPEYFDFDLIHRMRSPVDHASRLRWRTRGRRGREEEEGQNG